MDRNDLPESIPEGADHDDPPHVRTLPDPSTAVQEVAEEQETEDSALLPSMSDGGDQEDPFQLRA